MEVNYLTILYWFCHTSTWIHHGCTRVPHPEPPSHLPPCTIPLGHPSTRAPSILYPCFLNLPTVDKNCLSHHLPWHVLHCRLCYWRSVWGERELASQAQATHLPTWVTLWSYHPTLVLATGNFFCLFTPCLFSLGIKWMVMPFANEKKVEYLIYYTAMAQNGSNRKKR